MSRIWELDGEVNAVVESGACFVDVALFPDNQTRPRPLEGLPFLVKGATPILRFCLNPTFEYKS